MTDYFFFFIYKFGHNDFKIAKCTFPKCVFPTIFLCKWLIPCFKHSLIFSWGFYVIYVTVYFKCFMASSYSSTFNLNSFFTLLAFSLSYFGQPVFIIFLLIFQISTHFFIVYSSFLTTIYSLHISI